MTRWRAFVVLLAACSLAGCGPGVDLKQSAHVVDVTTGWFDAGVTPDGKNKLVPSISFRIKNDGSATIGTTQLNLVFKRVVDKDEWTTSFVKGVGSDGLAPGRDDAGARRARAAGLHRARSRGSRCCRTHNSSISRSRSSGSTVPPRGRSWGSSRSSVSC